MSDFSNDRFFILQKSGKGHFAQFFIENKNGKRRNVTPSHCKMTTNNARFWGPGQARVLGLGYKEIAA